MSKPNILLVCTDQRRYDALGCYGNPYIQTPAIDRLAGEGVLFEQCYVQSPVCTPSRASLATGQYVGNHGLWASGVALAPHQPNFSRAPADSGYICGTIGKMHRAACFEGRTEARLDHGYGFYRWAHDPSHGSLENDYHRWLRERHPDLHERVAGSDPRPRRAGEPVGRSRRRRAAQRARAEAAGRARRHGGPRDAFW